MNPVTFNSNKILPWFAAFFTMHLAARGIAVFDVSEAMMFTSLVTGLRGIISDALMALVLAFFVLWLAHKKSWLPHAFFIFWSIALSSNREYISEWASNMSVLDIAGLLEPEFIEGSVLTPRLFIAACALGLVGQAAYMIVRRINIVFTLSRRSLYALAALPLFVFLLPATPPQLWIQENVLEENVRQLVDAVIPDKSNLSPGSIAAARRFMTALHKQDLQGALIVTPHPSVNVIIVSIESLSDNILKHGWMPYLQQLADEHLYYPQYILPNLTTIRGLYAQFCGESTFWGRFGRDNMPVHIRRAHVHCLPDILTEQGYHTTYMQGADLGFQNKRGIIPATGFMEVLGNADMPEGQRYSEWGLDDASLFANAARKIETIETENPGTPWMIAMMTVGTHHPYNVNPSFDPNVPLRERAFRYTDQAIRQLVEWLKKTHRFEKTLLIITGDESREGRKALTGLGATIVRNQGLLVVLPPNGEKKRVTAPFMQTDLLLSILDFAMLDIPRDVGGRSIFREYKTFRPIAFANYSQQSVFAFWQPGELTQCRTDKWRCSIFSMGDKLLFDPALQFVPKRTAPGPTRALYEENKRYWFSR
jgi:hypothetical protein